VARDPRAQRAADREAQDRHALEEVREAAPPGRRRGLEQLGEDREEGGRRAEPHDQPGQEEGGESRRQPAGHHTHDQQGETEEDDDSGAAAGAQRARRIAGPEPPERVQRVDQAGLERREPPLVGHEGQERRHHPDGERGQDVDGEEGQEWPQHPAEWQRDCPARPRRRGSVHQSSP
jgi:hypothetical protein